MSPPKTDPEIVLVRAEPPELPTSDRPLTVGVFGLSDTGRVRPSNEDRFVVVEMVRTMYVHHTNVAQSQAQYGSHRGHLLLVADGVGGNQAGEVASALSVVSVEGFVLNTLKHFFSGDAPQEQSVLKEFQSALLQADARIFEEVSRHPELLGMATTLTMAFAVNRSLLVAHVGDSRCYLLSGGELSQLTQDHTMVAQMVRDGSLSAAEACHHPCRHVITNFLGGKDPGALVEMHKLDLEPGDVVLLCTDGLTEMLTDDRISGILQEEKEPRRACERLVAEANEQGGKDNITVIVACFEEG
jgi:protein phosphatase